MDPVINQNIIIRRGMVTVTPLIIHLDIIIGSVITLIKDIVPLNMWKDITIEVIIKEKTYAFYDRNI